MNIALIGYGRMGKTIERIAKDRGHTIVYINNDGSLNVEQAKLADVAIEFTQPDAAADNITELLIFSKSTAINGTSSTLIPTFSAGVTRKYLLSSTFKIEENNFTSSNLPMGVPK